METAAVTSQASTGVLGGSRTARALSGEDFFKLLIAQLSNQDPFEPTSNAELLNQIASIRDIELSTTLAESLKSLTDQQRYGAAASLIGRYVTGSANPGDPSAASIEGVVVGVRYTADGQPVLQLDGGGELPLERVETVTATEQAAAALIGKMVTGIDTSDPNAMTITEGLVTGVRTESDGTIVLELDTGEMLELGDVATARDVDLFPDDMRSSV